MKIQFVYPRFKRHADSHPELRECVPCDEYLGPPSLGIAMIAAVTPPEHEVAFADDRVRPFDLDTDADLYAFSFFTPAAERAFELADALRAKGRRVVMGGIFPSMMPGVAVQHADAVVMGEGETVWPRLLADAAAGKLERVYRATEPVDVCKLPPPRIDLYIAAEDPKLRPDDYPLQLSRGCPLTCDACVLPGTMTRKLRVLPRESYLATLATLAKHDKLCSLTEDTSIFPFAGARTAFRKFLADLGEIEAAERAASRAEGVQRHGGRCSYLGISMPMVLALPEAMLAEMRAAGIVRFYLVGGFDEITRDAFGKGDPAAMDKAVRTIARCHAAGIEPYTSFLAGNDGDDEGVFDRMLEFADRTRIEKAEFAVFTPYPGTPAWERLVAEDRILHRRWGEYNDSTVVFRPKQMSPERLQQGYLDLWRGFYGKRRHLAELDHAHRTIQF